MAKVGIVTFHNAHNFGAVLQCVSLKSVISNLGHEVSVIDHRNPEIEKSYTLKQYFDGTNIMQRLKWSLSQQLTYLRRKQRYKKYNDFINTYILCDLDFNRKKTYDCIVWGSDQIWSWNIIKDDNYFWGECEFENVRKISYAASAGKITSYFDKNLEYLKQFKALSVRENSLKNYLIKKGIKSEVSLDPTLLLSKEEWKAILPIYPQIKSDYILVYSMRNRKKVLKLAKEIAKREGLKIIEVFNSYLSPKNIFKKYSSSGPLDFISLIYHANFIVTDSFHGTAFSIIFNKQFLTVRLNDGHDNRAEDLLNLLDIPYKLQDKVINYNNTIDYSKVNVKLELLKDCSIRYLEKSIQS